MPVHTVGPWGRGAVAAWGAYDGMWRCRAFLWAVLAQELRHVLKLGGILRVSSHVGSKYSVGTRGSEGCSSPGLAASCPSGCWCPCYGWPGSPGQQVLCVSCLMAALQVPPAPPPISQTPGLSQASW